MSWSRWSGTPAHRPETGIAAPLSRPPEARLSPEPVPAPPAQRQSEALNRMFRASQRLRRVLNRWRAIFFYVLQYFSQGGLRGVSNTPILVSSALILVSNTFAGARRLSPALHAEPTGERAPPRPRSTLSLIPTANPTTRSAARAPPPSEQSFRSSIFSIQRPRRSTRTSGHSTQSSGSSIQSPRHSIRSSKVFVAESRAQRWALVLH